MTSINQEFIRTFESLSRELNRRASRPQSYSFELDEAVRRDPSIRRHEGRLRYIRDVRNTLQHPVHQSSGDALEVSASFLAEAQRLLEQLRNPPTASSIGIRRKQIRTAQLTDKLGELADEMKRTGFSHLPILDDKDVLLGVFNEAAMFDHLWAAPETIIGRNMQISDVLAHCRLDAGHTETFNFVRPTTPQSDLAEMFSVPTTPRSRVGAVFVTASGKPTEPITHLITPWDVLTSSADR